MTLQSDLGELMGLAEKAAPGKWRWSENGNIVTNEPIRGCDPEVAAVYTEHDDDSEPANSALICATVNFIRTHGDAIAALVADAERLDWLESQFTNGVHVEGCYTGSWDQASLQRKATVFHGNQENQAPSIREAIDAALASRATNQEQT